MAKAKKMEWSDEDDALLADLGVETEAPKAATYTPKQERIIAGFEDIQRFHREHGRVPQHGEDRDIFERLYAVRLDRICASQECLELLRPMDKDGLLDLPTATPVGDISDEELLDALGVEAVDGDDVTVIKHVRPAAERSSPAEVAQRKPCEDFDEFRPQFHAVQADIESGERVTVPYKGRDNQKIERGDWFILDGQKAFVAGAGETFVAEYGERDRRLRVIFDNGTESDLLMRSLRRALNKDERSRRITRRGLGPLFAGVEEEDDFATGYIYVLRSRSEHPFVAEHRELIHKIGVTGGDVKSRIAGAKKDPTYLLADVEIVATFKLANINRKKLETLLHKFFGAARLDLELKDRFGSQVEPREWYLVPLDVIDEAIQKLKDGTIGDVQYDPDTARLVPA